MREDEEYKEQGRRWRGESEEIKVMGLEKYSETR